MMFFIQGNQVSFLKSCRKSEKTLYCTYAGHSPVFCFYRQYFSDYANIQNYIQLKPYSDISKKLKNLQASIGFKPSPISWGRRKKGKKLGEMINFVYKTIIMKPSDITVIGQKTEDNSIF